MITDAHCRVVLGKLFPYGYADEWLSPMRSALESVCGTTKKRSPWRSMTSAPKDGTMILVTETPNGEHWNVMPACWMAHRAENINPNEHLGDWWGIDVAHWHPSEGPLHVRWKPLAITPVCWRPFPEPDPVRNLRRRMAQMEVRP